MRLAWKNAHRLLGFTRSWLELSEMGSLFFIVIRKRVAEPIQGGEEMKMGGKETKMDGEQKKVMCRCCKWQRRAAGSVALPCWWCQPGCRVPV